MISLPAFFRSLSTLHSASIRWIFSRPVAWARVDVPTLTVIRIEEPPLGKIFWLLYYRTGLLKRKIFLDRDALS